VLNGRRLPFGVLQNTSKNVLAAGNYPALPENETILGGFHAALKSAVYDQQIPCAELPFAHLHGTGDLTDRSMLRGTGIFVNPGLDKHRQRRLQPTAAGFFNDDFGITKGSPSGTRVTSSMDAFTYSTNQSSNPAATSSRKATSRPGTWRQFCYWNLTSRSVLIAKELQPHTRELRPLVLSPQHLSSKLEKIALHN